MLKHKRNLKPWDKKQKLLEKGLRRIELGISKMELANMCELPYMVIVDVDNGYLHHFKTHILENIEKVLEIE